MHHQVETTVRPQGEERCPSVSVVLVTYNRADVLGDTLTALLRQTLSDFELLVCDDASTDSTERVVRAYASMDSRIRYLKTPVNLGMPANLNRGISAARGEYIANLHDGDLYSPVLLEKWKGVLDQHPTAGFVFNSYEHIGPRGYVQQLPYATGVIPGHELLERYFFSHPRFSSPVWGTAMVRRSVFEQLGSLDSKFKFIADVDMWMRIAEQYDVGYVDEILIRLPSKRLLPTHVVHRWFRDLQTLSVMFWRARFRHYRNRPNRLAMEIARHGCYVVLSFLSFAALAVMRPIYLWFVVRK
jgi:glycosyltransferase involved in cell wall biosynthesis